MRLTASQKLQILRAYREEGGSLPYTKVLSQFRNGGDLSESGLPEKGSTIVDSNNNMSEPVLTGMMKARMAIAAQMGNTSAQRMTSVYPNRYEFTGNEQINGENIGVPKGEVGTHFMASMGEYAVPFIQERNNKLQFVSNPKYNDAESMRFESPEDAQYFAEHYKDVAPMMQSFATGGELPEDPPVTNLSNYIRDTSSSNDNTNYKSVPLRKGEPPIIGGTLPTVEIKASNTPRNYRNDPVSRREDIKTVPITKNNIHDYPVSVQNEFMKQQVADRPDYEAIRDFENFAATGFGLAPIGIVDDIVNTAVGTGTKYLPKVVDKVGEILDPFGSKMFPNAYKYNPWAFKPNPEAYYRVGDGKEFIDDVLRTNKIRVYNKNSYANLREAGKISGIREDGKIVLKAKTFPEADTYWSKGVPLDGRYSSQKYGDYMIEASDDIPFIQAVNQRTKQKGFWDAPDVNYNSTHNKGSYVKPRQSYGYDVEGNIQPSIGEPLEYDPEFIKLYRPHWLKGYKEIKVPKK